MYEYHFKKNTTLILLFCENYKYLKKLLGKSGARLVRLSTANTLHLQSNSTTTRRRIGCLLLPCVLGKITCLLNEIHRLSMYVNCKLTDIDEKYLQ